MKKIKSVKLKNDFRTSSHYYPKGTVLELSDSGNFYLLSNVSFYSVKEIEGNGTDLFEIEYEAEPKSITVKIEYDSQYDLLPHDIHDVINSCDDLFTTISFNVIKVTEVEND